MADEEVDKIASGLLEANNAQPVEDGKNIVLNKVENNGTNDGETTSMNANNVKTVYLVRHAESEENRRVSSLKSVGSSVWNFSVPTRKDVGLSLDLLWRVTDQGNTPISQDGQEQISNVAEQLEQANFWQKHEIQLVAHSPLQRAKDTAMGLLAKPTTISQVMQEEEEDVVVQESLVQPPGVRIVEVQQLSEKTMSEWIPGNSSSMWRRIDGLENWLAEQPETNIVCVGHSQFFKAMLHLDFKFDNCDVWQVQFDISQKDNNKDKIPNEEFPNLPPQWIGLKRLYQSEVPDKP